MSFEVRIDRRDTGSLKWDKYKGRDVLPFWVADMDFAAPPVVLEALHRRVDHGVFGYTLAKASCTEAVLEYLSERHGFEARPEWLLWTPGMVPALNLICRAFAEKGDGVMTFTPVYYPFLTAPLYAEQELQAVPLVQESDGRWVIDFEQLEARVTSRSRLLILCNPHNPVGKVFERSELEQLGEFLLRHDLLLCSDEIHCDLILNDKKHICAGTLPDELRARSIILLSPSKTYNLAGLSCAYAVVPDPGLRARLQEVFRGIVTEVNCFGYTACEAAYRYGEPWRRQLLAYLEDNRQYLYRELARCLPSVRTYAMDATYLAWLDFRQVPGEGFCQHFERHGVGLSEGATFQGSGFLRLNFGCPRSQLAAGLERLERAYSLLPQ
jgi:cystathionine beta-lyase